MGTIREVATQRLRILEPEHLVGRVRGSGLRLDERYVSSRHSVLRWACDGWELKDLGSRNGTFLDGERIKPAQEYPLRLGSRISFGKSDNEWEMVDVSMPRVMVVPLDAGEPIMMESDMLALPSSEDPRVTIYRADTLWVLEQPNEVISPIANLQTFEVAGRVWRFCYVDMVAKTSMAHGAVDVEVRHLQLVFSVSSDEEHVHLQISCAGRTIDLGARSFNYLLLTLARQRVLDAANGLPEEACGWVYQEDVEHDPSMAPQQMNLDVFRIRRHLAAKGVVDAACIIERRPRTRQIRIGSGLISIVTL
jgi:FHA domain